MIIMATKEVPILEEVKGITAKPTGQRSRTLSQSGLAGRHWTLTDGRVVSLYRGDGKKSSVDLMVKLKCEPKVGGSQVQFYPSEGKDHTIHVNLCLPKWRDENSKEKETIRQRFGAILRAAIDKGLTSMAILLDDCHHCGWGKRKAIKILVKMTLFVYMEDVRNIHCSYFTSEQEVFMILRDEIDDYFKQNTGMSVTDENTYSPVTDEIGSEWDIIKESDIKEEKQRIALFMGELAKMQCDAIVNTTHKDLVLCNGAVSASLLKAAGPSLQRECYQFYPHGLRTPGEIAVTKGYYLKCRHVFHGALPPHQHDRQMKCMTTFIRSCLSEAEQRLCKSIAFPALGTGNLKYPRDQVAKTMFDTVNSYFKDKSDSIIEEVTFVVYPKDTQTVKVFETEERRQKALSSASKVLPAISQKEKTGLHLRYGPIDLWITHGRVEDTSADGLIIFWDPAADLYRAVTRSYFNDDVNPKGMAEFRKQRTIMSSSKEPFRTDPGSLSYCSVVHCWSNESDLYGMLMKSLRTAEKNGLSHVVFSLGSKEPLTRMKPMIGNSLHNVLKEIKQHTQILKSVQILIDSKQTYDDMVQHMTSKYTDRIVRDDRNRDINPLGATGAAVTRRDSDSTQGSSTKMVPVTTLVLVGDEEDKVQKAANMLQDEIKDLQEKSQKPTHPQETMKAEIKKTDDASQLHPRKEKKGHQQPVPEFVNLDYHACFRVKIISRSEILYLDVDGEEEFVKFVFIFQSNLHKKKLQSDLNLHVTKTGYPPSIQCQNTHLDSILKSVLQKMSRPLGAINLSRFGDTDQVKSVLSTYAVYWTRTVVGYEVSGDLTVNNWLVGENDTMDLLVKRLNESFLLPDEPLASGQNIPEMASVDPPTQKDDGHKRCVNPQGDLDNVDSSANIKQQLGLPLVEKNPDLAEKTSVGSTNVKAIDLVHQQPTGLGDLGQVGAVEGQDKADSQATAESQKRRRDDKDYILRCDDDDDDDDGGEVCEVNTDVFAENYPDKINVMQKLKPQAKSKSKTAIGKSSHAVIEMKALADNERWQFVLTSDKIMSDINVELETLKSEVSFDDDYNILKVVYDSVKELPYTIQKNTIDVLEKHLQMVDAFLLQPSDAAHCIKYLQNHVTVKNEEVRMYGSSTGKRIMLVGLASDVQNLVLDVLQQFPRQTVIRASTNEEHFILELVKQNDQQLHLFTKFHCDQQLIKAQPGLLIKFGKSGKEICLFGPTDSVRNAVAILCEDDWPSKLLVFHEVTVSKPIMKLLHDEPTRTYLQFRLQMFQKDNVYEWKIVADKSILELLAKDDATVRALEHIIRTSIVDRCVTVKNPQACRNLIDEFITKQPEIILVYYPAPSGSEITFYGPTDVFSRTDFSTLLRKIKEHSGEPDPQALVTRKVTLDEKEYKFFMEEKLTAMTKVLEDLDVKICSVLPQGSHQLFLTSSNEQHLIRATTLVKLAAAECKIDFEGARGLRGQ